MTKNVSSQPYKDKDNQESQSSGVQSLAHEAHPANERLWYGRWYSSEKWRNKEWCIFMFVYCTMKLWMQTAVHK